METRAPKIQEDELEKINERLIFAAQDGSIEDVEECLAEGADINTNLHLSRTPLYNAVLYNGESSNKIIALLLGHGADLEIKDSDEETPLWRAVEWGNEENVQLLLQNKANPNAKNNDQTPALHRAIVRGSTGENIVKLLLGAGADIEGENSTGETPLWTAAAAGNEAIVQLLIQKGANVNAQDINQTSVLYRAVERSGSNEGIVKLLLDAKADTEAKNSRGETPLWRALGSGNTVTVDYLLQHKAAIRVTNEHGTSILHQAAGAGNENILRQLLNEITNDIDAKDENGRTPLWRAISSGNQACIDLLFERSTDYNTQDRNKSSLVHEAAHVGNDKALKVLISKGALTNGKDDKERTPLWRAISSRNQACIDLLFDRSTDYNTQDINKSSLVHEAAHAGNVKALKLLINKGALTNSKDDEERTPLWRAISSGNQDCIDLLFEQSTGINVENQQKSSLVHESARVGNDRALKLLISKGAPSDDKDAEGRTPLWIAVESGHENCVELLLDLGADRNVQKDNKVSLLHQAVVGGSTNIVRLLLRERIAKMQEGSPDTTLVKTDNVSPVNSRDNSISSSETTASNITPEETGKIEANIPPSQPLPQTSFDETELDIDTKDEFGSSPLFTAVKNCQDEIVDLLLLARAKLGAVDGDGDSELGRAAYHGYDKIVKSLLNKTSDGAGPGIDKGNEYDRRPLHWAAQFGYVEVGKLLLEKGASMTVKDKDGDTPFYYAAHRGHVSFMKLLLDTSVTRSTKTNIKGSKPKLRSDPLDLEMKFSGGRTALHVAANEGQAKSIEFLLESNADAAAVNDNNETALHVAVENGSLDSVKILLSKMKATTIGIKDSNKNTALHIACEKRNKSIVKEFLAESSQMSRDTVLEKNGSNETPLSIAVQGKSLHIVQLLVDYEADVKYYADGDNTWATLEDTSHDIVAIGELLDNGKSWENANETRVKTLHWAARNGYNKLVEKILPTAKSESGQALYWAAVGGQKKIIKILFGQYAEECLKRGKSGDASQNVVLAAARNGHEDVVQKLIEGLINTDKKAFSLDDDLTKTNTWTPLHWAVNYRPEEALDVVRYMLINGANPDKTIEEGISATGMATILCIQYPTQKRYSDVLALLESPLRVPRKPIQLIEPRIEDSRAESVLNKFYSNIVDFYTSDGRFCTLERKSSVYDIVYKEKGGPDAKMKEARKIWKLDDINLKHRLRWIHLPANNWEWAKDLMTRVSSESRKSAGEYTRLSDFVELNRREHLGKPQSRFMYPALTFESKEFRSAEGANIPKLQAEVREKRKREKEKEKSSTKGPSDVLPADPKAPKIGPKPNPEEDSSNQALGDPKRSGEVSKTLKKETDEKPKAGEKTTSHLEGSKLSLCMPFLTFQTVMSHRALRQAIRLAEKVQRLKQESKSRKSSAAGGTSSVCTSDEEDKAIWQKARDDILQKEIDNGLELLKTIGSSFYGKLDKVTVPGKQQGDHGEEQVPARDERIQKEEEQWLNSLITLHRDIRRSTTSNSPDILEWLERFLDAIEIAQQGGKDTQDSIPKHEALLEQYLDSSDDKDLPKGIHISRTLDQYYYAALSDTSRRDVDQVVRRYQVKKVMKAIKQRKAAKVAEDRKAQEDRKATDAGKATEKNKPPFSDYLSQIHQSGKFRENKKEIKKTQETRKNDAENKKDEENVWEDVFDAQIGMVDQLWLWIIDDKTVITCFPSGWGPKDKDTAGTDLLDDIRKHIHDESRPGISSVYHLATIITSLCVGYVEQCKAKLPECQDTFLHMFASSIGKVADKEVKYFDAFKTGLATSRNGSDAEDGELDIHKEILLLEEIKDIRDELNILRSIFEDQRALLDKLISVVAGPQSTGEKKNRSDPILDYYRERSDVNLRIEKIKKLDKDAATTYDSKNANIYEAKQARKQAEQTRRQAEQTTKQGRTILVFTIVTIVFLPLSFLTSLYALNVESFPHVGDDFIYPSKWIFSRIFGTSAAIGIPLVVVAIYINSILLSYEARVKKLSDWWGSKWWSKTQSTEEKPPPKTANPPVTRNIPSRSRKMDSWRFPRRTVVERQTPSQIESQSNQSNGVAEKYNTW